MPTHVNRPPGRLRTFVLMVPLIAGLAAPVSAASPMRGRTSSRCQQCAGCAGEPVPPRVVGLRIYNQPRMSDAGVDQILEMANRLWNPYGVSVEPSTSRDAITVVLSGRAPSGGVDFRPTVLGDTLFTEGHATPYIHLWPNNAEALAIGAEIEGRPFTSRSLQERHVILVRMLGVALAHELGHYLLDTANHSSAGLLRETLGVNDLAFPNPAHLRLTHEQQRMFCAASSASR